MWLRTRSDMDVPRAIVVFGPPGAGKGTQSSMLAAYAHVYHLSSGALARGLSKGSDLHARFTSALEATERDGSYFPDELARDLLVHEIETNGYGIEALLVLDGIPRTSGQVGLVGEVVDVRALIHLDTTDENALVERMRLRGERAPAHERRAYDVNETLARGRITEYRRRTSPLIDAYRSRDAPFLEIDALAGSPSEIHEGIVRGLASGELADGFAEHRYKSI